MFSKILNTNKLSHVEAWLQQRKEPPHLNLIATTGGNTALPGAAMKRGVVTLGESETESSERVSTDM